MILFLVVDKRRKKERETLEVYDFDEGPRDVEMSTNAKVKVRKYKNVRKLEEWQIQRLDQFFTLSDLR